MGLIVRAFQGIFIAVLIVLTASAGNSDAAIGWATAFCLLIELTVVKELINGK